MSRAEWTDDTSTDTMTELSELERLEAAVDTRAPAVEGTRRDEGFWLNWAFKAPPPKPAASVAPPFPRGTDADANSSSVVRYTPPARSPSSQCILADLDAAADARTKALGCKVPHLGADDVSFMESYMDLSESDWSQRADARTKEENFAALRTGRSAPRTPKAKALLSEADFSFSFSECPSIREIETGDECDDMSIDRHAVIRTPHHGGGGARASPRKAAKGDMLALTGRPALSPLGAAVAADFE